MSVYIDDEIPEIEQSSDWIFINLKSFAGIQIRKENKRNQCSIQKRERKKNTINCTKTKPIFHKAMCGSK